jgi:prophage antirepressor-like protein
MNNSNLSVFSFESSSVRVVLIDNEPWFVAKDVCEILGLSNISKAVERLDDDEKRDGITLSDAIGREQQYLAISESGMYALVLSSRKPEAKPFRKWVTSEVIPQIRKTGSYSTEQARQNLETQFLPERSIKELDEYVSMMKKFYGDAYAQRLIPVVMKKFHPDLPVIEPVPEERASVSDGEALLTPTQIAEELGLTYKTGNPNPQKVNKLLETLGFQVKIDGMWSATDAGKQYADRKPVSTNSRTQKDQLLWRYSVMVRLREYVI